MQRSPTKSLLQHLTDSYPIKLRSPVTNEPNLALRQGGTNAESEQKLDSGSSDDPAPSGVKEDPAKWEEVDAMEFPEGMLFDDPKIKDLFEEAPSTEKKEKKRLFGDTSDDEDLLYDPEATVVLGDPVPATPPRKTAKKKF